MWGLDKQPSLRFAYLHQIKRNNVQCARSKAKVAVTPHILYSEWELPKDEEVGYAYEWLRMRQRKREEEEKKLKKIEKRMKKLTRHKKK